MKASPSSRVAVNTEVGDLAGLDRLEGDSLAVFLLKDVRPLRGVAGFLDWRTNGALSRLVMSGTFAGDPGEVVLAPTRGRLGMRRCFLFGLGSVADCERERMHDVAADAIRVLEQANASTLAFAAPSVPERPELETLFVQGVKRLPRPPDVVLISPATPGI